MLKVYSDVLDCISRPILGMVRWCRYGEKAKDIYNLDEMPTEASISSKKDYIYVHVSFY